ncbi:MAG: Fic family protein [Bacteroidales bacterium]|jgi:Fic family protein|nr:Fic family protein [Bacteroidales bacterium]MCK4638686.1 Fic family protein [Bacteroidales bacterium]
MELNKNIALANELQEQLDKLRPLSSEMEKRIMQKFRLDWNYHSSHIEGNTLTYGETKALILFGQTAQAKPLRDHLEMSGHDEAIKYLEEIVKMERPLTENFIRELHKLILKEPYQVDAKTVDGEAVKKWVKIGQYKDTPNHIETKTGEMFYFASPEETPAKMKDLLDWYKENVNSVGQHPILFATEFHYRFVRIHPFDDGNGRLSRLLMNFILMQKGYPPAIIRTEEKNEYYNALQQADAGQLDYFFDYICKQVIKSLELMQKGAKGEDIEDDDDLDKKLALLKKEVEAEDKEKEIKKHLSIGAIKNAYGLWGDNLFNELTKTTNKFNEFYYKSKHYFSITIDKKRKSFDFSDKIPFEAIWKFFNEIDPNEIIDEAKFVFRIHFSAYKMGGVNTFGCNYSLEVKFEKLNYQIYVSQFNEDKKGQSMQLFTKKLLHQPLSSSEIKELNKYWGNTLLKHFEYFRNKAKKDD